MFLFLNKQLKFKLPSILDQFSADQLIAAVPKIILRKIYWDDLQEGDSVTLEVKLSEKLVLIYILLTGSYNPLYFNREFLDGKSVVPAACIMGFISAVGGCYLGGQNIFLVKKREASFYSPLAIDSDTLFIRGEVIKKYSQEKKGKERYYADLEQKVFIKQGNNFIKIVETGALAGILKKVRPLNQQKSELTPEIQIFLPELLTQLDVRDLRNELDQSYKPKSFDEIQIGDTVEIELQVTHKMILLFALISGDYNALHTDPEFVKDLETFEGKNIAHGALLSAWFSGLGVSELFGANYRLVKKEEASYNRAVRVEDEILIKLKVKKKIPKIETQSQSNFVEIEEKILVKKGDNEFIEAVISGSRYQLY
jgi:acyl dehydratase